MYAVDVIDIQKTAIWSPKEPRVVLDRISLCGCVDDREHLFEVFLDQLGELEGSVEVGVNKISRTPKKENKHKERIAYAGNVSLPDSRRI